MTDAVLICLLSAKSFTEASSTCSTPGTLPSPRILLTSSLCVEDNQASPGSERLADANVSHGDESMRKNTAYKAAVLVSIFLAAGNLPIRLEGA